MTAAALLLTSCASEAVPAKPAPALDQWHDTAEQQLDWMCDGSVLVYRFGDGHTANGAIPSIAVTNEGAARCQR